MADLQAYVNASTTRFISILFVPWFFKKKNSTSNLKAFSNPVPHFVFDTRLRFTYLQVMPEKYMFGRRPPFPLCNRDIRIVIGEPMEFNIPKLKKMAVDMSNDVSFSPAGWPRTCGLDEAAQRCLYTNISNQIRTAMERLRKICKSCQEMKD